MEIVKICIFAASVSMIGVTLRQVKAEYAVAVSVAVCVLIFGIAVTKLNFIIKSVLQICNSFGVKKTYISVVLKMIGVTYIAEFTQDLCRECGFYIVANQIGIVAKIILLFIGLPVLIELFDLIGGLTG